MAVSAPASIKTATGTTSAVGGTIIPLTGEFIVGQAMYSTTADTTDSPITLTTSGFSGTVTFTTVTDTVLPSAGGRIKLVLFVGSATSAPGTGTVTADTGNANCRVRMSYGSVSGGFLPPIQTGSATQATATTTVSGTLGATPNVANAVFVGVAAASGNNIGPATSYTEWSDFGSTVKVEGQHALASAPAAYGGTNLGAAGGVACAMEISASAVPGARPPRLFQSGISAHDNPMLQTGV